MTKKNNDKSGLTGQESVQEALRLVGKQIDALKRARDRLKSEKEVDVYHSLISIMCLHDFLITEMDGRISMKREEHQKKFMDFEPDESRIDQKH